MDLNHHFKYLHFGVSDHILRHKWYGNFEKAIQLIDKKLELENPSEAMRSSLIVQREIITRLPEDYPYTKEQAISKVQEHIPDFTEKEFDKRELNGEIDWIYINGIPHYFEGFYETLIKTDAEFAARAGVYNVISDGGNNEERRKFYFGNLDPFRMIANSEFQTGFTIPKDFWRADPYDNQSGEIETLHRGLPYFEYDSFRDVIEFEEL